MNAFWAKQHRKALVEKCIEAGLRKTGSNDDLKKRILHRFMNKLPEHDVENYADGKVEAPVAKEGHAQEQIVPADGGEAGGAGAGPADSSSSHAGQATGPTLWGRQTFTADGKEVEDKTAKKFLCCN